MTPLRAAVVAYLAALDEERHATFLADDALSAARAGIRKDEAAVRLATEMVNTCKAQHRAYRATVAAERALRAAVAEEDGE